MFVMQENRIFSLALERFVRVPWPCESNTSRTPVSTEIIQLKFFAVRSGEITFLPHPTFKIPLFLIPKKQNTPKYLLNWIIIIIHNYFNKNCYFLLKSFPWWCIFPHLCYPFYNCYCYIFSFPTPSQFLFTFYLPFYLDTWQKKGSLHNFLVS